MGLCKCPKKKVTSLFCFEHNVNVCEHCMVSSHFRCIVRSYLQWLQDSDFSTLCGLCNKSLKEGDVLRFVCYDIFHINCLDRYARSLPLNTAPAGYTCPTCKSGIFPAENLVSPVADVVRRQLAELPWARAGLGLSLLSGQLMPKGSFNTETSRPDSDTGSRDEGIVVDTSTRTVEDAARELEIAMERATAQRKNVWSTPALDDTDGGGSYSVEARNVHRDGVMAPPLTDGTVDHNRATVVQMDHDEYKYRRRSPLELLSRWFGLRWGKKNSTTPRSKYRRRFVIALLLVLAAITFVVVLSYFSQSTSEDDLAFLDPMNNPNIRVVH
ncbi:zinc finger protein-like 1 homolog isoform X2 [Corticium candelabrum]|uniref:zinc finger protein-like 1 homolog isoform X2 n=1 Tax=Corticium candelabrum TaxID=121492 RepID=UPI002E26F3AF|nr:zinc finger protein-like 1 homolog isoform X2 [Corticium candelabrum]